jgi:hypothetical protein
MANPDDLTLFARVRANIERYARQTGDATDITRLLMLAERGSMGEGEDTGPGWFVTKLAINQVRLPLRDAGDGDIEDADGRQVFLIDHNGERRDDKVIGIAEAVVLAINTCAGLHPRVPHVAAEGDDAFILDSTKTGGGL